MERGNAGRYRPVPDGRATLPDPTPWLAPFHNFPNIAMCKRYEQWTPTKSISRSFIEADHNFMFYCISLWTMSEDSLLYSRRSWFVLRLHVISINVSQAFLFFFSGHSIVPRDRYCCKVMHVRNMLQYFRRAECYWKMLWNLNLFSQDRALGEQPANFKLYHRQMWYQYAI